MPTMPIERFRNLHQRYLAPPLDTAAIQAFHRRLPGYAPTPLRQAPLLAASLGIGRLWVKDESRRLDMPAFKILGASWATYRELERRLGHPFEPWTTLADLRIQLAPLGPLTLVAATDGNHGRAVARMAAWLGLAAHILVPAGTVLARIGAIASEGAHVTVVNGSYDDAVRQSAQMADNTHVVISDTAWPGYEQVPRDVIAGYSTIFAEIDDALARESVPQPGVVLVQIGVGALAGAVVQHYRNVQVAPQPWLIGVEPDTAACVLASARAGRLVEVPGPHPSIMAGLNAGWPSPVAWPAIQSGIDLFLAITDDDSRAAMRALARDGIVAGETGAAAVAGLLVVCSAAQFGDIRQEFGLNGDAEVLVISTEGATDPAGYAQIVGGLPQQQGV